MGATPVPAAAVHGEPVSGEGAEVVGGDGCEGAVLDCRKAAEGVVSEILSDLILKISIDLEGVEEGGVLGGGGGRHCSQKSNCGSVGDDGRREKRKAL